MRVLLLFQLVSTLGMFGVIWFVQLVHYPLFLRIGMAEFPAYEAAHANRTTYIVAPLMLAELLSASLLLVPSLRPAVISTEAAWAGEALAAVAWLSTGLVQVPLHNQLHHGYSVALIRRLVRTNWIRTAAWTARAALVLFWSYSAWAPLVPRAQACLFQVPWFNSPG